MRRPAICVMCAFLGTAAANAQAGRSGDWMTSGNDAQRSSWVRSDAKISPASMSKPGFEFLWKMKLEKAQRPTEPVLMDRIIGYRGFRTLGFIGGSSDRVYVMDTDLARMEWEAQLPSSPAQTRSVNCPGGITSALARPTTAAFPAVGGGFGGFGRGGPAKSDVGAPGEGAVTLARAAAPRAPRPGFAKPPGTAARPARPGSPQIADGPFGRGITPVYAISSDGMLRILNVQNGVVVGQPYPMVPPGSRASGLIVVGGVAYATTEGECGGKEQGVWAVDTHSGETAKWLSPAGVAGPAVMGPDETLYVATRAGDFVALEARTLKEIAAYRGGTSFTASPVLFQLNQRTLLAAPAKDGSIHLVDIAAMSSPAGKTAGSGIPATSLASWQDNSGTRWLLAAGRDSVAAWKVAERDGQVTLEKNWTSPSLADPLRPLILNGVVFVAGGKTVIHALDGLTGKPLWNSGNTIPPAAQATGLSGGGGQVYLGTNDGTLYAFGFPMEH